MYNDNDEGKFYDKNTDKIAVKLMFLWLRFMAGIDRHCLTQRNSQFIRNFLLKIFRFYFDLCL